jgi:hypothetical protein
MSTMTFNRPTLKDVGRSFPSGAYTIVCDGGCEHPVFEHRFMGYTKKEALAVWRETHPRGTR